MKDTSQSTQRPEPGESATVGGSANESRTRDALRALHDSMHAAWLRTRDSAVDGTTSPRDAQAAPMRAPLRSTATSLHEVFGDFGQLGIAVADDAMTMAQDWGVSIGDAVRRHPFRSLAIAAVAGAALGLALRARRSSEEEAP